MVSHSLKGVLVTRMGNLGAPQPRLGSSLHWAQEAAPDRLANKTSSQESKEGTFSHLYIATQNVLFQDRQAARRQRAGTGPARTSGDRHVSHGAGCFAARVDTALHHLLVQQDALREEVVRLQDLR